MHQEVLAANRSVSGATLRQESANDNKTAASASSIQNAGMERLHSPKGLIQSESRTTQRGASSALPQGARPALCAQSWKIEDLERMSRARNYFAWQGRLVSRVIGRRVVEVGCGVGNFTGALLDRDVVIAVDPDAECLDRVRERYPNRPNLHTFQADASDRTFLEVARFLPHSCICLNVLEHIEDDEQAVRNMAAVIVPGGAVVLLLPAFPALYGPIDRNLGHHRRYRRDSVARLAGAAGLRVRRARYMNAIGFFGWWINARVLRRDAQSAAQIDAFDRVLVPLMARLESVAAPPFGQSLFAVLEKPA
jgi:SAM-dependent methyltransferase